MCTCGRTKTNMALDGGQKALKQELDKKLKRTISIIQYREQQKEAKESAKQLKLIMPPPQLPSQKKKKNKVQKNSKTHSQQVKTPIPNTNSKKQYTCPECDTKTSSLHSLKRHSITKHSRPVKYLCLNCGTEAAARTHISNTERCFTLHHPQIKDSV